MDERDYTLLDRTVVFQGARRVERVKFKYRRFSGAWTEPLERETPLHPAIASVLPYDPREDRVVLVEQFRLTVAVLGDPPWIIEQVAGRLDAGETPEDTARREALEESGCTLTDLHRVMNLYPAPGGVVQRWTVFVGRADAMPEQGSLHGLENENEDLRVHVLPMSEALRWLDEGRIHEAATTITLQWMALHRDTLRRAWT